MLQYKIYTIHTSPKSYLCQYLKIYKEVKLKDKLFYLITRSKKGDSIINSMLSDTIVSNGFTNKILNRAY